MMYNMGPAGADTTRWHNIPWAGVRTSNLRDVVEAGANGAPSTIAEFNAWGQQPTHLKNLQDFGGYTAFAEMLPRDAKPLTFPAGLTLVANVGRRQSQHCAESTSHTAQFGKLTLRMKVAPTITDGAGCRDCIMLFSNNRSDNIRVTGVLHWSWAGTWLFFWPEQQDATTAVAACRAAFQNGDIIIPTSIPPPSKPETDNLGLGWVHGSESSGSFEGDPGWKNNRRGAPARVRLGSSTRDFTVWTINSFHQLPPGSSYSFRQFLVVDRFPEVEAKAKTMVGETRQRYFFDHSSPPSSHPDASRNIGLYKDGDHVGVALLDADGTAPCIGTRHCVGATAPRNAHRPLFFIRCGSMSYFGSDLYHFKDPGTDALRPYAECDDGDRPTWKLLGFFVEDACVGISSNATLAKRVCGDFGFE
jgi:hypothetical protein